MNTSGRAILKGLASRSHRAVGALGEAWLAEALRKQGYRVTVNRIGQKRGDLEVIDPSTGVITKVEVKTARRCTDGKWRYTLVKQSKAGVTDHRHADVVALLAVTESGRVVPFVVPVDKLATQRQAVITSHPEQYAGKLACWRCDGAIVL